MRHLQRPSTTCNGELLTTFIAGDKSSPQFSSSGYCYACITGMYPAFVCTSTYKDEWNSQKAIRSHLLSYITHDMLSYITHDLICHITPDLICYITHDPICCYITHDLTCYITHDLICYITHDLLYNTPPDLLYNT